MTTLPPIAEDGNHGHVINPASARVEGPSQSRNRDYGPLESAVPLDPLSFDDPWETGRGSMAQSISMGNQGVNADHHCRNPPICTHLHTQRVGATCIELSGNMLASAMCRYYDRVDQW
eukprot:6483065-Amphidinium_carterae.1